MAVRPIVLYPDPVLLRPTRPVERFDDALRRLVDDMRDTMYAAPGIGLAANQIGVSQRVCVVDLTAGDEEGHFHIWDAGSKNGSFLDNQRLGPERTRMAIITSQPKRIFPLFSYKL